MSDNRCSVNFNVREFAEWVNGDVQNTPSSFCGITQSTYELKPGMLYVALQGERFDGHNFVADAVNAGAAAALVERGHPLPGCSADLPLIRVDNTRCALLDAARAWRGHCRARIIGITGSCGKTTTKEMCAALCAATGKLSSTIGNLNNEIGLPLSLLSMESDCDFGVFELGTNHPGEIQRLAEVLKPDFGVITGVGTAHIENFGSVDAIALEKAALASAVRPNGCLFLSMDDTRYDLLRSQSSVPVFTVSLHDNNADFYGEIRDLLQGRLKVTERCSRATVELKSDLPGEYNATNLLLAFAAARCAGVAAEVAASALNTLKVPSMRWQRVKMENSVEVVNDAYNANPESVKAVLNVFARMQCDGRRIVVLGDMLELGGFAPQFHREVGADAAASAPDLLCLVGEFSSKHTAEGALEAGFDRERLLLFDDAVAAGNKLKKMTQSGDLILIKGSRGMMLERVVNQMRC